MIVISSITCSFEELLKEFKSLWPIFNQFWRKFSNVPEKERQTKFYDHVLNMYSITHPNVCDMILLLYSREPIRSWPRLPTRIEIKCLHPQWKCCGYFLYLT